jgi:hypothetical protein
MSACQSQADARAQLRGDLQFRDFGSPLKWAKSILLRSEPWFGAGRGAIGQPTNAFGIVANNQSRNVCRSMPQGLAASPRVYPSSTNASPNIMPFTA